MFEIYPSPITGKQTIFIEDFIRKYKDTDNEDIRLLIDTILSDFLIELTGKMRMYKLYLHAFMYYDETYTEGEYNRIKYTIDSFIIEMETEYDFSNSKDGFWEFLDHDLRYYWDQITEYDITLEQAVDLDFINKAEEKGRLKCKKNT